MNLKKNIAPVFLLLCIVCNHTLAATDTLRVLTYNVLYYGQYPNCQGPNSNYHAYLKTIVQYANPDIIGLEKMGSITLNDSDYYGDAPFGFADSVLDYALNAAFPNRYANGTLTNNAHADNMSVLFYNQQKLGFVSLVSNYSNITDFNTYKLYYKDSSLGTTHDTTFLYITLNHTQSGDNNESVRGAQIAGEMSAIATHFYHLPNMLNMGDFNLRSSLEPLYQTLTAPADTNFLFYDPPFNPDQNLSYPANWDANPSPYTQYLTTSTRESASVPNSCGTSGGAKSWYDHMFISPWIANNADFIRYIPGSYHTIGNDGQRLGISVNDNPTNTSAPSDVINAIFQMSNKYPVTLELEVSPNTGNGPANPEYPLAVSNITTQQGSVSVVNPVDNNLILNFSSNLEGKQATVIIYDIYGRLAFNHNMQVNDTQVYLPCQLQQGMYFIRVFEGNNTLLQTKIFKN
jgi:hypothetical protein